MYVCMYACMYVCSFRYHILHAYNIHTHMHTHMQTHTYIQAAPHIYKYTYLCIYTYLSIHPLTCLRRCRLDPKRSSWNLPRNTHDRSSIDIYVCMCMCVCMIECVYWCMYACIYICMYACVLYISIKGRVYIHTHTWTANTGDNCFNSSQYGPRIASFECMYVCRFGLV